MPPTTDDRLATDAPAPAPVAVRAWHATPVAEALQALLGTVALPPAHVAGAVGIAGSLIVASELAKLWAKPAPGG